MARQGRSADARFGVFRDAETDWVFSRTLAFAGVGASENGECLQAARQIDERDGESWIEVWASLASRVERHAEESLTQGHAASARNGYLRATNYYRTAEYGAEPSHPRFDELWTSSVRCFDQARQLFSPPIQRIELAFDGRSLPGYFWAPDTGESERPTLVAAGGNDSTLEEVVLWSGMAAVERGYNFFTFDHPGHRGAFHLYRDCIKRPDYEVPYAAALDLLETMPGVDDRIAITGYSFGGYVACRVAAHERRIAALVPNPPIVDAHELFGAAASESAVARRLPPFVLNALAEKAMRRSPLRYSLAKYIMATFGVPDLTWSEFAQFDAQKPFTVADQLASITCPALALVGAGEGEIMIHQTERFLAGISSETKKSHVFTLAADGSNDHCQLDNRARSAQVMFDWLDGVFAVEPSVGSGRPHSTAGSS